MIVETYKIKNCVKVNIEKEQTLKYKLELHDLGKGANAFLIYLKESLLSDVSITSRELLDVKILEELKSRFRKRAEEIITAKLSNIDADLKGFLIVKLINDMFGLGNIDYLLDDENLEEIVIPSSTENVRVYHRKHGWLETNLNISREDDIYNYASIIARRVGRQITTLTPLLDAHLLSGDRANVVLFPISSKGNTITIRKFSRDPWTAVDFINNNTCSSEILALIWLAIEYELSILFSGSTSSGKTSFLNASTVFIPPNNRIISIEDTRELNLGSGLYWCPLSTRQANPEGKGEIDELDLLVNSLRMRPDRLILGEVRRKRQTQILFEAMHTGHSVYTTFHADSIDETITRLTSKPIEVPVNLLDAVDLNVVMFRDRRKGFRKVIQVGEFMVEGNECKANVIYRWNPVNDQFVKHKNVLKLFERLSRLIGMTQTDINKDLEEKERILMNLIKKGMRSMDDISRVMNEYYFRKRGK